MQKQELYHYGILGMRWGVRRSKESGSTSTSPKKSPPPVKKLSEMSDQELKERLDRFSKEKQYKQYLAEMNPKKTSRAKKIIGDIAEQAVKSVATKAIDRIAQNLFSKTEEDRRTRTDIDDPFSLGDKAFEKYMNRVKSEKVLKKLSDISPETIRNGKNFVAKTKNSDPPKNLGDLNKWKKKPDLYNFGEMSYKDPALSNMARLGERVVLQLTGGFD